MSLQMDPLTPMSEEVSVSLSAGTSADSLLNDFSKNDLHANSPEHTLFDAVYKKMDAKPAQPDTTDANEVAGVDFTKSNVQKVWEEKQTGMPGKDATPEEWSQFYDALGRPESAQEYELPLPEGDDGSFAQEIAPLLYQAGLSQNQAKELALGWNNYVERINQQMRQQQELTQRTLEARNSAQVQELKQEWQGRYDANIELARRAKTQFLPASHADEIINSIESAIGVKATIQLLHNIGKGLAEDDAAGLSNHGRIYAKTAAEVLFDKR